jgi:hypothetical protein
LLKELVTEGIVAIGRILFVVDLEWDPQKAELNYEEGDAQT